MQRPTSLSLHVAAYAAALTITACGALDTSVGADGTQSQAPTGVSETTTPYDANSTTVSDTNNLAGNTNTVTSPNSIGNTNTMTGNGNATNGNATNANVMLDCSKTWNNYAKAFFTNECASCHSHNHTNLETYSTVQGKASTIQTYISAKIMPVGTTLSSGDYNDILNWFACKMPQ